jgi:phage terminase small subunit
LSSDGQPKKLTPRQAAFVAEYLIDLNGTQAAIRAGYAQDSAGVEATRLLTNANIADAVARGKAQRLSRVNTTAESVLHEMSALAQSRIDHYVVTDEGQVTLAEGAPENAMAAVQSIKRKTRVYYDKVHNAEVREYDVEIRLWNKPEPLKLMGRHANVAACFDRVEVTGKDGGPIEIAAARLAELPAEQLQEKMRALIEASAA